MSKSTSTDQTDLESAMFEALPPSRTRLRVRHLDKSFCPPFIILTHRLASAAPSRVCSDTVSAPAQDPARPFVSLLVRRRESRALCGRL
ncbi:hypothetical protein RRG08_046888 [Elysia crispata]|uniref:Uncharacterized protein n=1 Tax=Elysia crispata TaxID=231223 RepID=A0AAE1DHM3_9GAST|nr:hypothetical protein RRG08_046888 [Elysia crispata]